MDAKNKENIRPGNDPIAICDKGANNINPNINEELKEIKIEIVDRNLICESKNQALSKGKYKHVAKGNPAKSKKPQKRKIPPEILKLVEIIKESTDDSRWSKVINEKNVVFYNKAIPNCPNILVKGIALLEGIPFDIAWKAIADTNLRIKWEKLFLNFESVENHPENDTEIIYFNMKAPFPVQDRDFLQRKTVLYDYPVKGQVLIHIESVECDKKPPSSKYVRAQTIVAGYLFKELSKFPLRCSITIINQVDLKGSIPRYLINMHAASGSRDWVESYRLGCMELIKNSKSK